MYSRLHFVLPVQMFIKIINNINGHRVSAVIYLLLLVHISNLMALWQVPGASDESEQMMSQSESCLMTKYK